MYLDYDDHDVDNPESRQYWTNLSDPEGPSLMKVKTVDNKLPKNGDTRWVVTCLTCGGKRTVRGENALLPCPYCDMAGYIEKNVG
jgi:hypothetical protein